MRFRLVCGFLIGLALFGADLPSFDAASVRPGSHLLIKRIGFSSHKREDATHFRAINCDLSELIEWAYQIRTDRISGPGELHSHEATFDINATMPAATTDAQVRMMLQRLLAERFAVRLHSVMKQMSGYVLVVDKGGPKLKASERPAGYGFSSHGGAGSVTASSPDATMSQLATLISTSIERPVCDQTGLDGVFDIQTEFSKLAPVESDAPTVFDAMKSLGLRLEKAQIPVESIVVDHANFKPSEN
ncbi:MAG TPA: TIGR03435 family protein [Bryobacteraceae bacterium]|nr:TIGR03435 family protein [Bryobacteraceae bacterium]